VNLHLRQFEQLSDKSCIGAFSGQFGNMNLSDVGVVYFLSLNRLLESIACSLILKLCSLLVDTYSAILPEKPQPSLAHFRLRGEVSGEEFGAVFGLRFFGATDGDGV
jgi:hypothetical protein